MRVRADEKEVPMIRCEYMIPSYGMTEYEFLCNVAEVDDICFTPCLRRWLENVNGVKYRFLRDGVDITDLLAKIK